MKITDLYGRMPVEQIAALYGCSVDDVESAAVNSIPGSRHQVIIPMDFKAEDERQALEMVKLRKEGVSADAIAAAYQCSRAHVYNLLKKAGYESKHPGPTPRWRTEYQGD